MDCARILLSLPSELAEIKRQLIQQQNELKIIGKRDIQKSWLHVPGQLKMIIFRAGSARI